MSCGGDLCLQSPINWTDTICAGNQIEVKYLYLADTTTPSGRRMGNYSIVNAHVTGATVQCTPGQVCAAGWYQAGELLPTLQTAGSGGMMENVGMNGTPGELAKLSATANDAGINVPLGPLLPTGVPIVIQLSGKDDGT